MHYKHSFIWVKELDDDIPTKIKVRDSRDKTADATCRVQSLSDPKNDMGGVKL